MTAEAKSTFTRLLFTYFCCGEVRFIEDQLTHRTPTTTAMKSYLSLFVLSLLCSVCAMAQGPDTTAVVVDTSFTYSLSKTDREAKAAVFSIVRYSGLTPNIVVVNEEVPNAMAYVKGKRRFIAYNPEFIARVRSNTQTDWAAISILAHEIGHHLLGHTLKFHQRNPGDELAADRYSGFILYQMGATLEEARAAMEYAGSEEGTEYHPPKAARLEAITSGWLEAKALDGQYALDSIQAYDDADYQFQYQCSFSGDPNLYFVNDDNEMVWYNNYGKPIVIGLITEDEGSDFIWLYHYNRSSFGVDSNGNIWNITSYGAQFKVGEALKLEPEMTPQLDHE